MYRLPLVDTHNLHRYWIRLVVVFSGMVLPPYFVVAQDNTDHEVVASTPESSIQVKIENESVTISVRNATISDVLKAIAEKSEIVVYLHYSMDQRISLQIDNLPFPEALARVLQDCDFALHYVQSTSNSKPVGVSKLWVYSHNDAIEGTEKSIGNMVSPVRVIQSSAVSNGKKSESDTVKFGQSGQEYDVSELSFALLDEDKDVRLDAISMLAEMGSAESLTLLASALGDDDVAVREQVVNALAAHGGADAIQLIEQAINDAVATVRGSAISALSEIGGEKAVRVLDVALRNQNPKTREEAIYALGDIDSTLATKFIERSLKDPDPSVRLAAVETLASTNSKESVTALAVALSDDNLLVKEEAIHALGEIGGESAVELLEVATNDKDDSIARLASETLDSLSSQLQ